MIHYHGTPLTPRAELQKMAGKHFCVSFAAPGDAEWCQRHGQSVMWDNGAFSAYTAGRKFDPTAFSEWVAPRLAHPHWAVVPDVIDGDVSDQRDLIASWHHPPILSAPRLAYGAAYRLAHGTGRELASRLLWFVWGVLAGGVRTVGAQMR